MALLSFTLTSLGWTEAMTQTTMTHAAENGPSITLMNLTSMTCMICSPMVMGKTSFTMIQSIWPALTFCCSLKTPKGQNPCHCRLSCPQTHCHGTHCRATRCHGILSRSHLSRCHPSLHPHVKVAVAASSHHAGSPVMQGAHGCCSSPQMPVLTQVPVPPHLGHHNPRCNCWPCGKVGWWSCRDSPALSPLGSRPSPGSVHTCLGLSSGSALDHCPQSWDGPKGEVTFHMTMPWCRSADIV